METLTFESSAKFMQWANRVVRYKYQAYDRAPRGQQVWTYGDGYVEKSHLGERGGTVISNLGYMLRTAQGELDHSRDARMVQDIDARGGVTITIDWDQ